MEILSMYSFFNFRKEQQEIVAEGLQWSQVSNIIIMSDLNKRHLEPVFRSNQIEVCIKNSSYKRSLKICDSSLAVLMYI